MSVVYQEQQAARRRVWTEARHHLVEVEGWVRDARLAAEREAAAAWRPGEGLCPTDGLRDAIEAVRALEADVVMMKFAVAGLRVGTGV